MFFANSTTTYEYEREKISSEYVNNKLKNGRKSNKHSKIDNVKKHDKNTSSLNKTN